MPYSSASFDCCNCKSSPVASVDNEPVNEVTGSSVTICWGVGTLVQHLRGGPLEYLLRYKRCFCKRPCCTCMQHNSYGLIKIIIQDLLLNLRLSKMEESGKLKRSFVSTL